MRREASGGGAPTYTSQDCGGCGARIQESLSVRTHICKNCGPTLGRDRERGQNCLLAWTAPLRTRGGACEVSDGGTATPSVPRAILVVYHVRSKRPPRREQAVTK